MNNCKQALFLVAVASIFLSQGSRAETVKRLEIRLRDPFVLADPATRTYFIYSSTDWSGEAAPRRRGVIVYRSKDLEHLETPTLAFDVPEDHWARESIWAPEVHRFQGKYDKLIILWSSYGPQKYATGIAVSASGKVAGPWEQQAEPLWLEDGGHPMLFETFDARLAMALHQRIGSASI